MKILCVIDSLGSGGAQRQMVYLAKGLKASGHDVDLFLYYPQHDHFRAELNEAGIRVIETRRGDRRGFSFSVLWSLISTLRKGKYSGAVSFLGSPNLYLEMAKIFVPAVRIIVSERSSYTQGVSGRKERISNGFHRLADAVVANSLSHASYLKAKPGLEHKCLAIWNGYPVETEIAVLERERASSPRFLVVGRISPEKNGPRIIEACARYAELYGAKPRVDWAGRVPTDPTGVALREEMEELLQRCAEVGENWTWLGEVSNMPELYRSYDCVLHVSLFEGLPNAICEAMMYGCPVIASDICDHPYLIGQNERGLLCDPHSVDSICDAMRWFALSSRAERTAIATAARRFAEERLSLETMVDAYAALLSRPPET